MTKKKQGPIIYQLKMTNSDEVVCEFIGVVEDESELIVKNALQINELPVPLEVDGGDGYRYHSLRPWMMYRQDIERSVFVNMDNIVAYSEPSNALLQQYQTAVDSYLSEIQHDSSGDIEVLFEEDSSRPTNIISFRKQ